KIGNAQDRKVRHLPGSVGDLIILHGYAGDGSQSRGIVEQGRSIAEGLALLRAVVDRIDAGRRVFESQIGEEAATREKVLRATARPTILDAGRRGGAVAPIDADGATTVKGAATRLNIDKATGAQAILRWKSTSHQGNATHKSGIQ